VAGSHAGAQARQDRAMMSTCMLVAAVGIMGAALFCGFAGSDFPFPRLLTPSRLAKLQHKIIKYLISNESSADVHNVAVLQISRNNQFNGLVG
jgi:hypothetical protein